MLTATFITRVDSQKPCPNVFKCGDIIVDSRDGFKYPTVQIGTQCWFQVSLHATKYLNGDSIPNLTDAVTFQSSTAGAWCDFNEVASNGVTYGHLYNWFASYDRRGLCPMGWYVPSNGDWKILINFLGGAGDAGTAMATWTDNHHGTNSSGFTALAGGIMGNGATFMSYGTGAYFWSSTGGFSAWGWGGNVCLLYETVSSATLTTCMVGAGYSVRCVRYN